MEDHLSFVSSTPGRPESRKAFEVTRKPSRGAWETVARRIFYHHWPKNTKCGSTHMAFFAGARAVYCA